MRGTYRPVADSEDAAANLLDPQLVHSPDDADDVEDRIHGAHLVEVNLLGRHPVNLSFGLGDRPERRISLRTHVLRSATLRDEFANLPDVAAVRLGRNAEVHFPAHELPAQHFLDLHHDVGQPKSCREPSQPLGVETDAEHGAEGHVAGDATERIQDRDTHPQNRYDAPLPVLNTTTSE